MFTSTPVPPGFIVMSHWNIVVLNLGDDGVIEKFLGLDTSTGRYRISSEVLVYDTENDRGQTRSGSRYRFVDKPGKLHPDAQQVLDYLNSHENVNASLKFPQTHDA
jgi:hypothetical protein